MRAGRAVLTELRKPPIGVGVAISTAQLLRRWLAQAGDWSAEVDDAP